MPEAPSALVIEKPAVLDILDISKPALSSTNDMPVIETVFLDGQEMPTIEAAEPDLSRLGIMVRGMHAFGVARQEAKGGFKFKQTAD